MQPTATSARRAPTTSSRPNTLPADERSPRARRPQSGPDWDEKAESYVAEARANWDAEEPSWGIWSVPESDATNRYEGAGLEWSRRWPTEEVWKVRRL